MRKFYSLVLVLLAFFATVRAGENDGKGQIEGKILTADGKPAAFVTILLKGTHHSTFTEDDGKFLLRGVQQGTYELEVSLIGHQTVSQKVEVKNQQTARITINLDLSDNELQEVIIIAAKNSYNTRQSSSSLRLTAPLLEIPQNIQIVSATALADQQIISMSDGVTRNISGAVRLEHWGDLYANITMRGSQLQAFRNGFNVVSSYWGPLTEDMSFVDHIEFVKGPAGFMLANGDPSGLYNVVTKKPTGRNKGEATMALGSFGLYRTTLDLDGKLSKDGRLLYRLNLAAQNKKSFRDFEFNDRYVLAPVISYQLNEKTKLTAEYVLQSAKMSDVGSYYVFATDGYGTLPRDFTSLQPGLAPTKINDQSITVNMQHQLNDDWKFTTQLAYYDYRQNGSSMWPSSVNADGTMIRSVGIWDAKSQMTLGQAFVNGTVNTGKLVHRVLAGVDVGNKEYFADWSQSHALDSAGAEFDTKNPSYGRPVNGFPSFDRSLNLEARAVAGGGTINQRYSGVYVQDEIGFLNNGVRLTLAGRYTNVKQSAYGGAAEKANHVTPRVGLSVSAGRNTSFYGLYDQAFIPQSGRTALRDKVKPITGSNLEFGVKRDWANGKWNTTLSVYRILKNNELTADPNSPPNSGISIILGEKRARGAEFDLRGTIVNGLNLIANYAFTESKVTEVAPGVDVVKAGDIVPGYAKHTVNSWLNYKVQDGVLKGAGISAGFTWLLDRQTYWELPADPDQTLPDYFKLDGGLFWESDRIKVTANVFNILDKYLYSGSYYSWLNAYYWQADPPRNVRFSVAYSF